MSDKHVGGYTPSDYWKKLQDPRWQKVRLKVMEAAGFLCRNCYEDDKTLTVHHTYYENGKEPWEYPKKTLRCYCHSCHETAQNLYKDIKRCLGLLDISQTEQLHGYAMGLALLWGDVWSIKIYFKEESHNFFVQGVADAWGTEYNTVIESGNWDADHLVVSRTTLSLLAKGSEEPW